MLAKKRVISVNGIYKISQIKMLKVTTLFKIHINSLFSYQVSSQRKKLCLQSAVAYELIATTFMYFFCPDFHSSKEILPRKKKKIFLRSWAP